LIFAVFFYAVAIIAANMLVAHFGPVITPVCAFFLIGFDLALRNWLALRMSAAAMLAMIVGTGLISYLINPASKMIAVASAIAFVAAALVDWWVFNTAPGSWMKRNFAGNSAGALVDSVIFPTLAFGALMPLVVLAQFVAKVAGGSVWGYFIKRFSK
jgi:queuosine precursor transporter